MTIITRLMSAIMLAAFASGCATSKSDPVPPAYGTGHSESSRHGEQLYAAEGKDEEGFAYQALMSNMLATASTALLLSSNAGIGLSLGKSFGLGFAVSMLDPLQDREQDKHQANAPEGTLVSPMALQTMTPEQLQAQLRASLQQISLQALVGMGVPQATLEQGLQYKTFYERANNSTLVASEKDGCIKMVDDNGGGACVLSLQLQAPVQSFNPQNPLLADSQKGTYPAQSYFGL
ncbi:hypothetical protein ACPF7Z_02920 [Halomonas sp. GXIMD04776]|uniref:hypothetical protein n=1 Tax=Halomonas sp. GXIMD04776 TaxID=3415605 RepID=UPI003C80B9D3